MRDCGETVVGQRLGWMGGVLMQTLSKIWKTPQTGERVRIPRSRKAGKFTEPKKDPMTRTEHTIRTETEN